MKHTLKFKVNLSNSKTEIKNVAETWQIRSNPEPIQLIWDNNNLTEKDKVMPILDEEYIEKSYHWHMYLNQLEMNERKMKWEKVSTNL